MQGRVVVLDFSATWFAPCRTAIQAMQQIHEEFGRRGVVVLGISVDEKGDPHEAMRELGATFPMLLDGQTAASEYGVEALPTIVVVDREGRIVLR
jgi:cytochrome c biogenesis protein CcmG, thiol:disulfide interchange protein DsbE